MTTAVFNSVRAEDWATWRHDRLRTGITSERRAPPLELLWTFRSRQARLAPKPDEAPMAVNRTPSYWQGKVYVGSDDGHAYCLDANSGEVIWKFNAAPADRWMFSYGKSASVWPVRTDVVVEDGVAYFGSGVFPHDGTFMHAVNAETGKLIWRNGVQCETGDRISMSPAGHLFVTRDSIWVPKDCWGYFTPKPKQMPLICGMQILRDAPKSPAR